ncbi:Phospholipid-transporting ATPase [Aphelenchoides besseyi]|nr:Phospholipid-transporting ATPase [Aphelenchoides besseyi]
MTVHRSSTSGDTTFPVESCRPSSSSRSTEFPATARRRPRTPPSAYVNPLFLGESAWQTSPIHKKVGWNAKMSERLRRCWRNSTAPTSDGSMVGSGQQNDNRERNRANSTAGDNQRTLRANNRDYNSDFGYADNYIKTSKYNAVTFFAKKNLFEQFQRLANFYFLVLMVFQLIPWITSIAWYSTAIPLFVVLGVSAVKDGYDDIQRHRSDSQVNNRISYVVRNGRLEEERWMNVKVGDVIRMENEHFIAADLLLLSTSEPHGISYIETAELDGETNLKTRSALPETAAMGDIVQDISDFDGEIICEAPNNRLDRFEGRLVYQGRQIPLDNNKMLLRGCRLRNTRWCYGLVVFAGKDTKLMMNSGKTKFKRTSLDRFLNILIMGIVLFLIAMCLICTILCGIWEWVTGRHFTVYLEWDKIVSSTNSDGSEARGAKQIMIISFLMFFSYIILLNTVVPISLYVSVEIIRFAHSVWINSDMKMYYAKTDTPARARTTTLNEELGQVQYIFSDKTGTLTQNIMTFNKCSINGRSYGDLMSPQGELIDITPVEEFWRLLAICHTVMPERKTGTLLEYQAQSPDEAALTAAARNFGFVFKSRTPTSLTLEIRGKEETFEVLQILDFDNVRKRMSVIVRTKDEKVRLYCKGADTMVMARIREDTSDLLRQATMQHLDKFAADGLRTLCVGYKDVDADYVLEWMERQQEAALDVKNKDERLVELYEEIESGMTLLGATAIEDKLQDGVPETISKLSQANIKIWVLTGDKTETAINIGYSCQLLTEDMKEVFIVDGKKEIEVEIQLKDIKRCMEKATFTHGATPTTSSKHFTEKKIVDSKSVTSTDDWMPANIRSYISEQIRKVTEMQQREEQAARERQRLYKRQASIPMVESPKISNQKFTLHGNNQLFDEHTVGHQDFYHPMLTFAKNVVGASSFYDHPKSTFTHGLGNGNRPTSQAKEHNNVAFQTDDGIPNHPTSPNNPPPGLMEDDLPPQDGYGLVINGESLVYALRRKCEKLFLEAVICCRVTPLQKAQVVDLVKRHKKAVTLSIGDGANDVSMIKTAHIGVGISGQEGMQAVLASDYSIGQFCYLQRLLLVHGRWSYFRMCKFLRYFFYKNFSFTLAHFWYSFFCGYSAQTVYDAILIACYNMFFTALPVLAMGVFDQDVSDEYSLRYPKLYIPGQYNLFFNMRIFTYSVIHGMISSLVLFFVPYGALHLGIDKNGHDVNDYPMLAFTVFTSFVACALSKPLLFPVIPYPLVSKTPSGISYGVALRAMSTPHFWFSLILICVILLLPVMMNRFFWFDTHPSYADRLRVRSKMPEYAHRDKAEPAKPQMPRTAATRRSRRGSLRSGYAFSHTQGFGDLIAKGTLFKNIEHLRTASTRSYSPSKSGLSPNAESSSGLLGANSLSVPRALKSLIGGKSDDRPQTDSATASPHSTNIPAIRLPEQESTNKRTTEIMSFPTSRSTDSSSNSRHSTPPISNTMHSFVVNQDSNPLPSGWHTNPDGSLAMAALDHPPPSARRNHSIASTSSSTTINGVDIPIQPIGKFRARRATIEMETDLDDEEQLTSHRRQKQYHHSSRDQSSKPRHSVETETEISRRKRNVPQNASSSSSTDFPVHSRHPRSRRDRHGDTLV